MKASRTRYSIVALAIGLAILSYIDRVAISQAAGPISADLHLTKAQMGLVFSAFGLSYALFEVPIGRLGDRIGVRRVLVRVVLGWSFFTALTGARGTSSLSGSSVSYSARAKPVVSHPHAHAQRVVPRATSHRRGCSGPSPAGAAPSRHRS